MGIYRRCNVLECPNSFKDTGKWSRIRAQDDGWFFQKNGVIWCPDHWPLWVVIWRRNKKIERRADII